MLSPAPIGRAGILCKLPAEPFPENLKLQTSNLPKQHPVLAFLLKNGPNIAQHHPTKHVRLILNTFED